MIFATVNDYGLLNKFTANTYGELYHTLMDTGWIKIDLQQAIENFEDADRQFYANEYEYAIMEFSNIVVEVTRFISDLPSYIPYIMVWDDEVFMIKDILDVFTYLDMPLPDFAKEMIRRGDLNPYALDLVIQTATLERVWIYINPEYDFTKEEN